MQEIAEAGAEGIIERMQKLYTAPVREDLVALRIQEIKTGGGFAAIASSRRPPPGLPPSAVEAGADLFVVSSQVATARHFSTHAGTVDLAGSAATRPCQSWSATASRFRVPPS